jgi:phosphohistidine phosphatase
MTKTLCLLRHAKSSWEDPALDDHDRPLAPRGREAAPKIATWLKGNAPRPDLVLCSDAARTRETWALVAPRLEGEPPVRELNELYHAEAPDLLKIVRATSRPCSTLLIIGHNPCLERLAADLVGAGEREPRRRMAAKFPTAAVALITFELEEWQRIGPGSGTLRAFVRPKDLA